MDMHQSKVQSWGLAIQPTILSADIHASLREKEQSIHRVTPVWKNRHQSVQLIYTICKNRHLQPVTASTSVALMDHFIHRMNVPMDCIPLVVIACVLLAAKWEEKELDIPRIDTLRTYTQNRFTRDEVASAEMAILKIYNWNITTLVPHSFVHYYIRKAAAELPSGVTEVDILRLTEFFLEFADEEPSLIALPPSVVACSAITTARVVLGVTPFWSLALQGISGLTEQACHACVDSMCTMYRTCFYGTHDTSSTSETNEQQHQEKYVNECDITTSSVDSGLDMLSLSDTLDFIDSMDEEIVI